MNAKLSMALSMLIFGTIGIFVQYIDMPSGVIAAARGFIGMLIIGIVMPITRQKPNFKTIKKKLPLLLISGAAIGFNWILLFEAYRHTGIPVATVCYYMAPIFVIMASPFILKEKPGTRQLLCIAAALVGAVLVSGVLQADSSKLMGILMGIGAAILYASVILMNKFLGELSAYEKTAIQLGAAAITVTPYALLAGGKMTVNTTAVLLLAVVGVVHTGLAYTMYFGAIKKLKAQTVAILSYIDPASAILLSAMILGQSPDPVELIGALLIIGAAFISEVQFKNKEI